MEEKKIFNHSIIVENRKKFNLGGIKDVTSFDDETIVTESSMGNLVIKGQNLRILNFDNSSYELQGEGKINAIVYTAEENGSFLSRLFR